MEEPQQPDLEAPPAQPARVSRLQLALEYLFPRTAIFDPPPVRQIWLATVYAIRRWLFVDRSTTLASSLALQTLLSLVPFAGLVLTLLGLLGEDSGRSFIRTVSAALIPDPGQSLQISERVYDLATRVTVENLGVIGFLGSIGGAMLLFITLEDAMNQIWRAKLRRSLVAKFAMFYTLTTLAPLVIFFSIGQPIVARITDQRFSVLPFLSTDIAFILLLRFLPATAVSWRAATIGGLVGAALFEVGKRGFTLYLATFRTYEGTYGALALIPVFCVWAYFSWLIVLLAAELAYVAQHIDVARRDGFVNPRLRRDPEGGVSAARMAARIVLAICDHYDRRGTPLSSRALVARFSVESTRLTDVLTRLEAAGVLLRIGGDDNGYVPARPLDQLRLLDILRLFRADAYAARHDSLTELFERLDRNEHAVLGPVTFQHLIEQARERRAHSPAT
jgi:membrane protein